MAKVKKSGSKDKQRHKLKRAMLKQREGKRVTSKVGPVMEFMERPAMSDMDAPKGFRAMSIGQAMQEYGAPLLDRLEGDDFGVIQKGLNLIMQFWNYAISVDEGEDIAKQKKDIMNGMRAILNMPSEEAEEFLSFMIERKKYVLPPEIQPKYPNVMFVRKEGSHIVREFDYSAAALSDTPFPADEEDLKLIENIQRMDKYIKEQADYSDYEQFCMDMEQECMKRYERWLIQKGINDDLAKDFSFNIELFLNFVYQYMHDDVVVLRYVPPEYFAEFFMDYVLRKVIAQPHELVGYVPSVKYFYRFLVEKGYIESCDTVLKLLDIIEVHYMKALRERYS
jgi:hypothetical protein